MVKQKSSKTAQNMQYLTEQKAKGREHVFASELPYPQLVNRCNKGCVLAIEGSKIYLREKTV